MMLPRTIPVAMAERRHHTMDGSFAALCARRKPACAEMHRFIASSPLCYG
jgi:hypothetical protein